jgi:hypothetical protein
MATPDTALILNAIASVRAEVTAAEGRVRDEVGNVEARLFEQLAELKRDQDAVEEEVSELKLAAARGGAPSMKRDGALVGGTGALTAALLALAQWLTVAPPPPAAPRAPMVQHGD